METSILKKAVKFLKGRKKYAVALMGVLAITAVGYGMARPALTLEREAYCGLEEHTHTAECYAGYQDGEQGTPGPAVPGETDSPAVEKQLNCTVTGPVAHTHGENCYGQDGSLICPLEEKEAHTHTEDCYEQEGKPICGKEETEGHTHDDSCYTVTKKLICGKEEAEAHTHDSSCYGSTLELTCDETEEEGHSHGDDCLDADGDIACGKEETAGHTHGDSCYTEVSTGELVCGKEETEGHTHTEDCYEEVEELTCGKEEAEGHTHTEECYEGESKLICGKEELEEHVHGDECFSGGADSAPGAGEAGNMDGTGNTGIGNGTGNGSSTGNIDGIEGEEMTGELICGKVEHVHTEECYNPKIMLLAEGYIDGDDWWELSQDGVLSIHVPEGGEPGATMAMANYNSGEAPWYKYREQITSVVIGEGVTGIGSYAFYRCAKLSNVELTDGIVEIGSSAFKECTSLEAIHLPEGVKAIEDNAFYECSKLSNVELADGIVEIGNSAFERCEALETIELPEGIKKISSKTFYNSGLKNVAIPKSVESIEENAFNSCGSLSTVVIPADSNLTAIGRFAFRYCRSLENIVIPEKVTNIGSCAFQYCDLLESVTIPEKVTNIEGYTFDGCKSLQEIVLEAADLGTVGDSAFPNSSLRRLIVKCGSVERLNSAFLSAWPCNDVRLEGQGHFSTESELALGQPVQYRLSAEEYYADGTGALYAIEEGEAALAYVPAGVETYTILSEVPLKDGTGNLTVTSVKCDALRMADSLTDLTFQSPENIKYLPGYACGNCPSLKRVNGYEKVSDILALFAPDARIDFLTFYNTGLEGGQDDISENGDIVLAGGAIRISTEKAPAPRDDGWNFYTGQSAKTTVYVSNQENMDTYSVVRCYIVFDKPEGKVGHPLGEYTFVTTGGEQAGTGCTVKVCESDAACIYYYEINKPKPGETLTFDFTTGYPSPSSGGGTAKIWAVMLTEEEKERLGNGVTATGAENQRLSWDTKPDTFPVKKEGTGKPTIAGDNEEEGITFVKNLNYAISMNREGDTLEGIGKDYMVQVDFTDTLQLPEGMKWRDGLIEAVEAGQYSWKGGGSSDLILSVTMDGNEYEVFKVKSPSGSGTVLFGSASSSVIEDSDGTKKLQMNWTVKNYYVNQEMNMPKLEVSFGGKAIVIDGIPKENFTYKIDNHVDAVQHFNYSEVQKREADAEREITTTKGDYTVEKTPFSHKGTPGYLGEEGSYTITVTNSSSFPYPGLDRIEDELNSYYYLSQENMKALFQNVGKGEVKGVRGLRITISNATLCRSEGGENAYIPGKEVTGTDGGKHNLHQGNSGVDTQYEAASVNSQTDLGRLTNSAVITLQYNKEENNVTLTYGYDGDEKTISGIDIDHVGETLESIGFLVTPGAKYALQWVYEDGYVLYSGSKTTINLPVTIKDSFMLLGQDIQEVRKPETIKVGPNLARVYENDGRYKDGRNGIETTINRDFRLDKSMAKKNNGEEDAEKGVVVNGDIVGYTLSMEHRGNASYDIVPLVDRMEGAQALLVPAEGNEGASGLEGMESREVDGKTYYLLNKPGTYSGVRLGGCLTDSIEVKKGVGGLDTVIRWYLADVHGNASKTISYDAIVDAFLAGENPVFSISNTGWLNDHQTHRLFDTVGMEGTNIWVEKNIVTSKGDTPSGDTLEKYSGIKEGQSVTYRLELTNVGQSRVIRGADICDILPETAGFQWSKGDNVAIQYGSGDGFTVEHGEDWNIEDVETAEGKTGGQKIQWGNTFAIHLENTAYIYVTLTYPKEEQWQAYVKEHVASRLENTFYCYQIWDKVNHELSVAAEAYLQKGVAYTGEDSRINGEEESRLYYSNTARKTSSSNIKNITYYVLLYNSGKTRLYLNKLQDRLPKGFWFVTTLSSNVIRPKKFLGTDGSEVEAKYVTAAGRSMGNGRVDFTLSGVNLQYDEFYGKYYLAPGQAVYFGYQCRIGEYADTDDAALNQIAMPYTDMNGAGLKVTQGISPEGSDYYKDMQKNDGGCEAISNDEAVKRGFEDTEGYSQWMVSDVEVRRNEILPGITKRVHSTEGASGAVTSNPYHAAAEDTINWEVTVTNSGRNLMENYTLTDIMEYPYAAAGTVKYTIYDASGKVKVNASWDLFQIEGWDTDDDGVTLLKLKRAGGNKYGEQFKIDSGSWSSVNNSGQPATLKEGSTLFVKSDYEYFEYEVRFQTNKKEGDGKKEVELSITFNDSGTAIPAGGRGVLIFPTRNRSNEYLNKVYTNTCYITPEQPYDGSGVNQGVQTELHDKASVRNRAQIQVTYGDATRSVKKVEEIGNPVNRATSEDAKNYILLPEIGSLFRYTLQVDNIAANKKAIEEMVLIDGLPQVGDHNPFTPGETRDSQFKVRLADDPKFKVFVETKNESGTITGSRELGENEYILEYSTRTEFDASDWAGGGSWDSSFDAQTRSFRIILKDTGEVKGELIPVGASVIVEFNGQIVRGADETDDGVEEDPEPGAIAWNSFGYHYKFVGRTETLEATPLNVGVRIPDVPRLTKKLEDEDGNDYKAKEDGTFRFLIYEGKGLGLGSGFTEAGLAKALKDGGRAFTLVDVAVKKGNSLSDDLILKDLKAWDYEEVPETAQPAGETSEKAGSGSGVEWKETDTPWVWQEGGQYTIVELPVTEESGYQFGSLGGFGNNGYTFRHSNAGSVRITAVNTHQNPKLFELPESGGTGVQGYMLAGVTCLLAAGFLLYRKRRDLRASR